MCSLLCANNMFHVDTYAYINSSKYYQSFLHWVIITSSGLFVTRDVQQLVPTLLGVVCLSDFGVCVQCDTDMRRLHKSTHVVVQNEDDPDLILSPGIC